MLRKTCFRECGEHEAMAGRESLLLGLVAARPHTSLISDPERDFMGSCGVYFGKKRSVGSRRSIFSEVF